MNDSQFTKDTHPFKSLIPENAKKLIIGTIPPHRFCEPSEVLYDEDVRFYYGSCDNEFWCLIGEIFSITFLRNNSLEAIRQREEFLLRQKMGITDIISTCRRENNSASDNMLKDIEYLNIKSLLSQHSSIDTLLYTSLFVKKCMNTYLGTYHSINPINRSLQYVRINGKQYTVRILYSPSPQALRGIGKNGSIIRKEQYEKVFSSE